MLLLFSNQNILLNFRSLGHTPTANEFTWYRVQLEICCLVYWSQKDTSVFEWLCWHTGSQTSEASLASGVKHIPGHLAARVLFTLFSILSVHPHLYASPAPPDCSVVHQWLGLPPLSRPLLSPLPSPLSLGLSLSLSYVSHFSGLHFSPESFSPDSRHSLHVCCIPPCFRVLSNSAFWLSM